MTPSLRACFVLLPAILSGSACSPSEKASPPPAAPVTWIKAPEGNRVKWMNLLADSGDPAAAEMIRIHLWDADASVAGRALELLKGRNDAETAVERWLLENPGADTRADETAKTLDDLLLTCTPPEQVRIVTRAMKNSWRAEFSGLSLSGAEERLKDLLKPGLRQNWVKAFEESGGGTAVVAEDGISRGPQGEDSGMRSFSPKRAAPERKPNAAIPDAPFPGAWAMNLGQSACAAVSGRGRWFGSDGRGNLLRGSMASGEVQWSVPFPIPPDARILVSGDHLEVRWTPVQDSEFVLEFSIADGTLLAAALIPVPAPPPLATFPGGDTLTCEDDGGRWTLRRNSDGHARWSRPVLAPVVDALLAGDDLFISATYPSCAALARLHAADGSPVWCRPLAPADESLRFRCLREGRLWLLDGGSWISAVDIADGALVSRSRWSNKRFSNPVMTLEPDDSSGKFLLDPSTGFLYGVPADALLQAGLLPEPDRQPMAWEAAFGEGVFVGKDEEPVLERDLLNTFAGSFEHDKFSALPATNREETWTRFAEALRIEAEHNGTGADDLEECLEAVSAERRKGVTYAPTIAWRVSYEGEDAWLIVCNWETEEENSLGHIAAWAVSRKEHKVLGFQTCQ